MNGLDLVERVTCNQNICILTNKKSNFNVAVIDFGIKKIFYAYLVI